MLHAYIRLLLSFVLAIFMLAACAFPGTGSPPATDAPAATDCFTEAHSQTALEAVQEKTAALIPGARVIWYDGFDCSELGEGWAVGRANPSLSIGLADGKVTLRVQRMENIWDGMGRSSSNQAEDMGVLVSFEYEAGTSAPLFLYTGDWQTQTYRRAGLTISKDVENTWQVWEASTLRSYPIAANVLRPDTPCYLTIIMSRDGQVNMKIWEIDNPGNHAEFQDKILAPPAGRFWASLFQLYEGALKVDEYVEFSLGNP